jgi:pre-mRNA-processing factor 6
VCSFRRLLLARARERAPSPRVWLKSALLERECAQLTQALAFLDEGIAKFATFHKFYLMAAQICFNSDNLPVPSNNGQSQQASSSAPNALSVPTPWPDYGRAREYLQKGLAVCPENAMLWSQAIRLEEQVRGVSKARSMADLARLRLPKSDQVRVVLQIFQHR